MNVVQRLYASKNRQIDDTGLSTAYWDHDDDDNDDDVHLNSG